MRNILTKRSVQILSSVLVFGIAFALFQYSPLNALHGRSDAPLIVAIFGAIALIISYIFKLKATTLTSTFGYILALILGVIFNTDGVDGGGAATNNLWLIWFISYLVFIGVGVIADLVKGFMKKQTKFNYAH